MPLDVKSFPCVNKNKGMNHLPTYLSIFEGDNEVIGLRFDAKLSVRLSSHPIFKRGRNIFRRRHSCRPTLLPCRQIVVVIFVIFQIVLRRNCFTFLKGGVFTSANNNLFVLRMQFSYYVFAHAILCMTFSVCMFVLAQLAPH